MAEQDSDRTEQASPYKLEEARKSGQTSKSIEIFALFSLVLAVVLVYALFERFLRGFSASWSDAQGLLRLAEWTPESVAALLSSIFVDVFLILSPLLFALVVGVIALGLMQTGGLIFSAKPIGPDFSRLNPAQGFKRFFSMRLVYDFFKTILKLVVLSLITGFALMAVQASLTASGYLSPRNYVFFTQSISGSFLVKFLIAALFFAFVDLAYSKREFAKQMRMSHRDLREEHKHREGDPRIRAKLRELRNELMKRLTALKNVPGADVIVTNPTHLAIAIRYNKNEVDAPQVVAKGAGEMALLIRNTAFKHRIPIVRNERLARALFASLPERGIVPEALYPEVAKVLLWVYSLRSKEVVL